MLTQDQMKYAHGVFADSASYLDDRMAEFDPSVRFNHENRKRFENYGLLNIYG